MNRRAFIKSCGLATLIAASGHKLLAANEERPNILWLTSEDNSPYLGCYGDKNAITPNLDNLAKKGVMYTNAFANAPVCSAARSTLITGMYASSLALHNHRSKIEIPQSIKTYPAILRHAGYYCTNNSKTDYNFPWSDRRIWDQCSGKATYLNCPDGKPFFAVYNSTITHEGQITKDAIDRRRKEGLIPPMPALPIDKVVLPPYYPDTKQIRYNIAVYYDNITLLDKWIGQKLRELKESGKADNTIIFYYGDHGGAIPRGKRNIHDSGTRVPFIVYFPEKWKHLAPVEIGTSCDDIVTFCDFPSTLLSIAGINKPHYYEGNPILGKYKGIRNYAYLYRGRMDERYDTVRSIRTDKWQYIRNYSTHRPWGQQYFYPFGVQEIMGLWYGEYKAGRCNAIQSRYWEPKPGKELYYIPNDPYEVRNLAGESDSAEIEERLSKKLREEILESRDTGFIPEGMYDMLAKGKTIYDFAQSENYKIERILEVADAASDGDVGNLGMLISAASENCGIVRYWAATGLLILGKKAQAAKDTLNALLSDKIADVRVVASEALVKLGDTDKAIEVLADVLVSGNEAEMLASANSIQYVMDAGVITKQKAMDIFKRANLKVDSVKRIFNYIKSC